MFEIFREPVFWILMGVCYALIVISASVWAKDLGLKMNIWKWLFAIFWFLLLTITIAGGFTLYGENEMHAGTYFLGFFGVLDVVLPVFATFLKDQIICSEQPITRAFYF